MKPCTVSRSVLGLSLGMSLSLTLTFIAAAGADALASSPSQTGTLTHTEGAVKLFTQPSKSFEGASPRVLFEGNYYTVREAKVGDQVEKGNVLRTAPSAKAKLIFENGDQFMVGPGTAYRVDWNEAQNTAPKVNLMHGRIRGVVSKQGPRSGLTIRTRSATMGVRGTDFTVADHGPVFGTEVAVLRGKVEVKPQAAQAKAVEAKAGSTVEVTPAKAVAETRGIAVSAVKAADVIEVRKTSKTELVEIHQATTVEKEIQRSVAVSENTRKKVQALEKKAVQTTLADIKASDPALYAKLQTEKAPTTELLNASAVETVFEKAPARPTRRAKKPSRKALEEIESDAYDRFFNVE